MGRNELKPCPFCGAKAELSIKQGGLLKIIADHDENCPFCELAWYGGYFYEEDAIFQWNRRAEK